MKTVRKTLILAACAMLLVCATVVGTLAYLTAKTSVTNTFTVGNVSITMDETDVDNSSDSDRDTANSYKLLPGQTYTKDPIIHVGAGSEDCYVFVKVENEIASVEDAEDTVAAQMQEKGWVVIDQSNGIYGKEAAVSAGADVEVFDHFKVSSTATNDDLTAVAGKTIVVTAYAIQAKGFTSASDAWTNAGAEAQG